MTSRPRHAQSGGITILVVLSLLVLMTTMAIGMSRNSLREIFIVGSSRQAAVVRHTADTGLEYTLLWMKQDRAASGAGAVALQGVRDKLVQDPALVGTPTAVSLSGASDVSLPAPSGQSRSFKLSIMRMGKVEPANSSPTVASDVSDTRLWDDLWVVQASGLSVVGSSTFQHDKEAWIKTAPQTTSGSN